MSQAAKRKNSAKVQRRKIQVSNASRRRSVEQEIIEKHETVVIEPIELKSEHNCDSKQQNPEESMKVHTEPVVRMRAENEQIHAVNEYRPTVDIAVVNERMRRRSGQINDIIPRKPTAKELKDAAIQRAMTETRSQKVATPARQKKQLRRDARVSFGFKRVILALACAAAGVFAIVHLVNLNSPNISLKVAAMQSGIEASYPAYVPRDFNLSDITSEDGKIVLNFRNPTTGDSYSITEENSSWDSNALYTNFVKANYSESHTVIKEQGLTIYIDGSDACWVNKGVSFKLKTTSGSLTKKQITTIAVSL